MGTFTTTSKNIMLDALTVNKLSLHSANPGVNGTDNELTGGSPAYARKAATYAAANNAQRLLNADVIFDVPAGATVAYVCKWTSGTPDVFRGVDLVTSEVYGAQGTYTVKLTQSLLQLTD